MECEYVGHLCPLNNSFEFFLSSSKQIFELMGFSEEVSAENELTIQPPYTDTSTPEGRINKRKLLRAWVELSSWLADFYRLNGAYIFSLYTSVF